MLKFSKVVFPKQSVKEGSVCSEGSAGKEEEKEKKKKLLGKGTHGAVWETEDGLVVKKALIVDVKSPSRIYMSDGCLNEMVTLCRLTGSLGACRNIVRVLKWESKLTIDGKQRLSELTLEKLVPLEKVAASVYKQNLVAFIRQLFTALRDIHARNIVHCDLKMDNIMYNRKTEEVELIDFGLSKIDRHVKTPEKAMFTFDYQAPEILLQANNIDLEKADIWAGGVCAISMMLGFVKHSVYYDIAYDEEWDDTLIAIFKTLGIDWIRSTDRIPKKWRKLVRGKQFTKYVSDDGSSEIKGGGILIDRVIALVGPSAADFILHALEIDPSKRWKASRLLQHPFLVSADSDSVMEQRKNDSIFMPPNMVYPVSETAIKEIRRACRSNELCYETVFKALDILANHPENSRDPIYWASAIVVASSITEPRLINAVDIFESIAPWVNPAGREIPSIMENITIYPGVISTLSMPSVLQIAHDLFKSEFRIDATLDQDVPNKYLAKRLLELYVKLNGQRPSLDDIKSIIPPAPKEDSMEIVI